VIYEGDCLRDNTFPMKESNYNQLIENRVEAVENKTNFEYINSLLVKETHDTIFQKKTSNIPVDNGSSLNIPITIKIIALTNRTLVRFTHDE
jgi:hypothetical protein